MSLEDVLCKQASYKRAQAVQLLLWEAPQAVKFIETKSRMGVARGWGRGRCCLMSIEFQSEKIKKLRS